MGPELTLRLKTAAILIVAMSGILAVGAIFSSGRFLLLAVAVVAVLLATVELADFSYVPSAGRRLSARWVGAMIVIGVPSLVTAGLAFGSGGLPALLDTPHPVMIMTPILLGLLSSVLGLVYFARNDLSLGKDWFAESMVAVILLGVGGAALVALAGVAFAGAYWIAWLVVVVAVNDSAAYFGGRALGGPKLAPAFSPKKTMSGSMVGLAAGCLVGVLCSGLIFPGQTDNLLAGIVAVLVVIAAQIGDLLKSYLKRLHNTKDSGSLLPGHGGVLDRIDGILGGAPVLYAVLTLL